MRFFLLLALLFLVAWVPSERKLERELSERVWRVCLNEGALLNVRECALVWQVVEGQADDAGGRMDWLAKHSPRVHGLRPCDRGNCLWTRGLTRELSMPAALASGHEPYWRVVLSPRAQEALLLVERLVSGEVVDRPCPVQPSTWGGPMDTRGALAGGLFPIGCSGTLNDGFAPWSRWLGVDAFAVAW